MKIVFINEAFTKGVEDYLNNLSNVQGIAYNSFLTVVVRFLISIYSELDIINPYKLNDYELLKSNLQKYGYSEEDISLFFQRLQEYYEIEILNEGRQIKEPNRAFVEIQKQIVDMFIKKKLSYELTKRETDNFYYMLYTPYAKNPLQVSYNFLTATDPLEVDNYFKKMMSENVKEVVPKEKHFLNVKAYELLNYSMDNIKDLDSSEIDKINTKVYDYLHIRENAINKEYLLEKALENLEREQNKVTSGNGYVDILLVLSIISTVAMLVTIAAFVIF